MKHVLHQGRGLVVPFMGSAAAVPAIPASAAAAASSGGSVRHHRSRAKVGAGVAPAGATGSTVASAVKAQADSSNDVLSSIRAAFAQRSKR